jgi:hypothetical protein
LKVTVREFHWALSGGSFISEPTVRRLVAGKLPHRRGDRRNIWDPPKARRASRLHLSAESSEDWTRFLLPVTHDVYEKAPDGPVWRMRLEGRRPVPLDEFATSYVQELAELEGLVSRAEELAAAVSPAEK